MGEREAVAGQTHLSISEQFLSPPLESHALLLWDLQRFNLMLLFHQSYVPLPFVSLQVGPLDTASATEVWQKFWNYRE